MARQLGPQAGAWCAEESEVLHVLTVGGWQVFLSAENVCCACCVASPTKGTKERSRESFTGLTDQPPFRAQESAYRDGKQHR